MRLACLVFAGLLLFAAGHTAGLAFAFESRDRTFAPGRVGAIEIGKTKPADLAKIYGAANVTYRKMGYEGGETPGAYVFQDSPYFLQVMFDEDEKTIESVIVGGRNWVAKSGLRVGLGVGQLERLNGGAFTFQGFGADEAGRVYAEGGALKPYGIHLAQSARSDGQALQKHFREEKVFSSRHPAVKEAGLEVGFIIVYAARLQHD